MGCTRQWLTLPTRYSSVPAATPIYAQRHSNRAMTVCFDLYLTNPNGMQRRRKPPRMGIRIWLFFLTTWPISWTRYGSARSRR